MSEEGKEKIRKWHTGYVFSSEAKKKMRLAKLGIKYTEEHRLKIRNSQIKRVLSGKHNNFKGWISPVHHRIRESSEYKLWREAVFKRDDWTCQKYGMKGCKLHPHHIQNFSQFPELRFEISNGITLSEKAHKEFHKKYGSRNNTREQIIEFLKKL